VSEHGNGAARRALRERLEREAGVVRRTRERARIEAGTFDRDEAGDVDDWRAFDRHMQRVGEEDQSAPGWDDLP
jgi:hypothetical protein